MDIEQLTKHQIVLLTLLVSFVTSIATGIVTVSLMSQAPVGVTRVVNQIVEHTVETVMPANQSAAVAQAPSVVVAKDEDLATQAISTVQKSVIRLTKTGGKDLVARGVIISVEGASPSQTGIAVSDAAALLASGADSFDAILQNGERVPVRSIGISTSTPIAQLTLAFGTTTAPQAAHVAAAAGLRLGQSVVRIGGVGADVVGSGVIASLPRDEDGAQTELEATVASQTPGSVLSTLTGEVIGITTATASLTGADFYSILNASAAQATAPTSATSSQS